MYQSSYGIERLVQTYESLTMRQWVSSTTIFQSPLVKIGRHGHLFRPCENLNVHQRDIYSDHWQRLVYSEAVAYYITFLNDI